MEKDIDIPGFQLFLELSTTLVSGNVCCKGDDVGDGLDGHQINPNDQMRHGHVLCSDLQPPSRRSTQIHKHSRTFQEIILFVQLHELKGRSGSVALLLGQMIILVQTPLSRLFLDCHLLSMVVLN